ncbi:MAG: 50S ribosomal protein L11 methyltransferase [Bacillota bacterium]
MKWAEVRVRVAAEAVEAVSNELIEEGAGGVAIQDPSLVERIKKGLIVDEVVAGLAPGLSSDQGPAAVLTVVAYFPATERLAPRLERLRRRLRELPAAGLDPGPAEVSTTEVDDRDWADAWKAYFKPRRLGRRMVIRPTWEEYESGPDDLVIVLDPGMAFGTGTHATTAGCLLFLEEVMAGGERVIDVGTGSGVLAVAAAKLGAASVASVDLDEASIIAAEANVLENGVADRVSVAMGDAGAFLDGFAPGAADLVAANLVAGLLVRFAGGIARVLRPGGLVIGSGIVDTRLDEVVKAFAEAGLTVVDRKDEGDWVTILATRGPRGQAEAGAEGVGGRA